MYQKPELTVLDALGQLIQPGDKVMYISGMSHATYRVGIFLETKERTSTRWGRPSTKYKFKLKHVAINDSTYPSTRWIEYNIDPTTQEGHTSQLIKLTAHSLQLLEDNITKKLP